MTDIALRWSAEHFAADLALSSGQLVLDEGLRTAILLSLFSDARAPVGAELPEPGDDRRGWWGDAFAAEEVRSEADALGSTLWLLGRAKALPQVAERARRAAEEALGWLIRDGVAAAVRVEAAVLNPGTPAAALALGIELERPQGPGRQRFDFVWDASSGQISTGMIS